VCTDSRFLRFSNDDTVREAEYGRYLRDREERARREFNELLAETRSITHTTWEEVTDDEVGEARMAELRAVLGRDSRYLELDSLDEARTELLMIYLAKRKGEGAPLPPTADVSAAAGRKEA